jgi:TfoX/Sxy family transcriptional regulator of competence genes
MSAASFEKITRSLLDDPDVSTGRMFGSEGLKVNGKVFAMVVKGDLVVKLPAGRCASLIEKGRARPFDPGHGRLMKEWVAVPPSRTRDWPGLANEARAFVGGG